MIRRFLALLAALAVLGPPLSTYADPYDTAVLQGMDKVTARVSTFRVAVGDRVLFGALDITVQTCDKRPPTETPESAVFLDIRENRQGEPAVELFRGWMFASSPALSALEHPVYDVWAIDCENRVSSSEASRSSERSQ